MPYLQSGTYKNKDNILILIFCFRNLKDNPSKTKLSGFRKHLIAKDAQGCQHDKLSSSPLPDLSTKPGLAVWISRNCGFTHGAKLRSSIMADLIRNYFDLDFTYSCIEIRKKTFTTKNVIEIISSYKFYMAFENTYKCREYITEKFWYNSLYAGTVPIVWGACKKDYQRIAPPKSFIFYEDFRNIKEFIDYINYLDKNDTAYLEYFSWRKQFPCKYPLLSNKHDKFFATFVNPFTNAYCNLCKTLREKLNSSHQKTIPSLNKYWFGEENKNCLKLGVGI